MWRATRTCLLGAVILCACNIAERAPAVAPDGASTVEAPTITGQVRAHEGSSLTAARLSVSRSYFRESKLELRLDPDGRFRATLPGPGVYVLYLVGVDEAPLRRAFAVDSGVVEVAAQLGTPVLEIRGEGVVASRADEADAVLEDLRTNLNADNLSCESVLAAANATRATLEALDDQLLTAFAMLEWAQILAGAGCLGTNELRWVLDTVPADHVAWAFQGARVHGLFADKIDDPLVRRARQQLAAAQIDPGLRAHLLYLDIVDADQRGDTESVHELYAALTSDFAGSFSAQFARESYDPDRPLQVGRAMPAWSFVGLEGGDVRSADFEGRPYLLEVWAPWCGPCIDEMEIVHAAWESLDAEAGPVSFVWVSIDTKPDQVRAFRRERWPMPWTHAHEPDAQRLYDAWWFGGIPMAVLVDGEGRIVATTDALRGGALRPTLLEFTEGGSR